MFEVHIILVACLSKVQKQNIVPSLIQIIKELKYFKKQ